MKDNLLFFKVVAGLLFLCVFIILYAIGYFIILKPNPPTPLKYQVALQVDKNFITKTYPRLIVPAQTQEKKIEDKRRKA